MPKKKKAENEASENKKQEKKQDVVDIEAKENKETKPALPDNLELPVLPLRDVVVYPNMVIPLFVGREKSIQALEKAMVGDKQIMLVAQKEAEDDDPDLDAIYQTGAISTVLQLLKLPDGTVKVLVEGEQRAEVKKFVSTETFLMAELETLHSFSENEREVEILIRTLMSQFEQYVKVSKKIPSEVMSSLASIEEPGRLADTIAAHLTLKVEEKQEILDELDISKRIEKLMGYLETELDILQIEKRVRGRVKRQMEKHQQKYYLEEQMKAIQKELGELGEEPNELEDLAQKIKSAGMPKDVKEKAEGELKKLKMMSPMSAEATVMRNYLDWMLKTPWKKRSKIHYDLEKAQAVLDEQHYGLDKVKERIVEYLAVQQRVKKLKGQVICLVGPPGVGKTSLGQSIAQATGRTFVRIALGGVRDEAEIRGHRRTYIGSMPGKIIQKLAKGGVKNPLVMLDEVDKMAMDFRGDPAAALLEVLDPEQNHAFNDHYLEVDYDLSEVMFIATANSMEIPEPLLDRMEVIRLAGYTEDEKVNIANKHLIPKELGLHGLKKGELEIPEDSVRDIIRYYTREAGVRNLSREIAKVSRKVVRELLTDTKDKKKAKSSLAVKSDNLEHYLGVKKHRYGLADEDNQIGKVTGLAWTSVGGELLSIEATVMPGKGKSICTGKLGEVMQESIQAAMTCVRSRALSLGILPDTFEKKDIHVHVPEGATPKDGPSAGIAMATALVSVLTEIPIRADVAMTGEITLRGHVLPIGGLKEKLLAAHRGKIKRVLIPDENKQNLADIPDNIKADLEIFPVSKIEDVFELALEKAPEPISPDDPRLSVPKKDSDAAEKQAH